MSSPHTARTQLVRGVAAAERGEVTDALRRRAREMARAGMREAGLLRGETVGRRRFAVGRRAAQASAALCQLSADLDARQIHANALLAANRHSEAIMEFRGIDELAATRLYRDVAAVGASIAYSLVGERDLGLRLCRRAAGSPIPAIATSAALTLVVQSAQLGDTDSLRHGLELCREILDDDHCLEVARHLSNYTSGPDSGRRTKIESALERSHSMGCHVVARLREVLAIC